MNTHNQIGFITEKIQQLQTAISYCHSNSLLKLPSSVVQTEHVDETGCLWIYISKPSIYMQEFDHSFHVALNYYKKGSPFYLNTLGLARVVNDPEELNALPESVTKQMTESKLLLCIKILEASYFETQPKPVQNIFQKCTQSLTELFYGSQDHYYFHDHGKKFVA